MPIIQVDLPQFSFREAALAANVSPTQLRNWLDRRQILLDANMEREDASWRKFSILDVLRIAFVSKLAGFTSIVTASELVESTMLYPAQCLRSFEKAPASVLEIAYKFIKYVIYNDGENIAIGSGHTSIVDEQIADEVRHGACTFLVIIPGPIVRKIVENLGLNEAEE